MPMVATKNSTQAKTCTWKIQNKHTYAYSNKIKKNSETILPHTLRTWHSVTKTSHPTWV